MKVEKAPDNLKDHLKSCSHYLSSGR